MTLLKYVKTVNPPLFCSHHCGQFCLPLHRSSTGVQGFPIVALLQQPPDAAYLWSQTAGVSHSCTTSWHLSIPWIPLLGSPTQASLAALTPTHTCSGITLFLLMSTLQVAEWHSCTQPRSSAQTCWAVTVTLAYLPSTHSQVPQT